MQNYSYYSTLAELEKVSHSIYYLCMPKWFLLSANLQQEGIEGKTFLEFGCGPCPIGQRLAKKVYLRRIYLFDQVILPLFHKFQGAKKVYGLDISSGMIEAASRELTALGIRYEMYIYSTGSAGDYSVAIPGLTKSWWIHFQGQVWADLPWHIWWNFFSARKSRLRGVILHIDNFHQKLWYACCHSQKVTDYQDFKAMLRDV